VVHGCRGFVWHTAAVAGVAHGFSGFVWNMAKAVRLGARRLGGLSRFWSVPFYPELFSHFLG
jgi:hypothetical protein